MNAIGPPSLTPTEMRSILARLQWGQRSVAEHLGINPQTARRWAAGDGPIPLHVQAWLRALDQAMTAANLQDPARAAAAALERHPLPEGWATSRPAGR